MQGRGQSRFSQQVALNLRTHSLLHRPLPPPSLEAIAAAVAALNASDPHKGAGARAAVVDVARKDCAYSLSVTGDKRVPTGTPYVSAGADMGWDVFSLLAVCLVREAGATGQLYV